MYLLILLFLVNWCAQWFEYFPNPPLNVLAMVENLLAHHDAELLEHFVRHSITTQVSLYVSVCIIVAVRPSVLDTVKQNNNKYSRFKEENPALLE